VPAQYAVQINKLLQLNLKHIDNISLLY